MATKSVGTIRALMEMASRKYVSDTAKGEKSNKKFNKGAQRGFRKSNKAAGLFTSGMKRMLGAVIAVAGVKGLTTLIKSTLDTADTLAKTADKVGFSTDALQELRFAAKQSGVEFAATDIALQRFSRRIGEAANGQGVLFKTLKDNNIRLRDQNNRLRSSADILDDYADLIGRADDSQQKLLLTFQAFDTEGAALVNLLGQGSGEMKKLRREARDLGLVLDEDLLRGAEGANDALDIMSSTIKTQLSKQVLELAPAIETLAMKFIDGLPGMLQFAEEFGKFVGLIDDTNKVEEATKDLGGFALEVASLAGELGLVRSELKVLQDEQAKDPFFEDWQLSVATDEMDSLNDRIKELEVDLSVARTALANGRKVLADYKTEAAAAAGAEAGLTSNVESDTKAVGENTAAWLESQKQMAIMANTAFPDISESISETERRVSRLQQGLVDVGTQGQILQGALEAALSIPTDGGAGFKRFVLNLLNLFEGVILASGQMSAAFATAFIPGIGIATAAAALVGLEVAKAAVRAVKFHQGGAFTIGGKPGGDTPVMFTGQRDETVTIQTPSQRAAGIFPGAGQSGGGGIGVLNLDLTLAFEGITPEQDLQQRVIPGLELAARNFGTELISIRNIASGSDLGGDLNRSGKG